MAETDRCYRLKLFLEQFGIRSCVLNSELPANSRIHVVEEFNRSVYDIIIASDEQEVLGLEGEQATQNGLDDSTTSERKETPSLEIVKDGLSQDTPILEDQKRQTQVAKKRKTTNRGKEYGISRGIDFQNVACVMNFDLPTTSRSYTHRIGRTARAGKSGIALSFVVAAEHFQRHKPTSIPSGEQDEEVMARIIRHQAKKGRMVTPYHFDMKQVEGFRYRMDDALRAVTRVAIREARTRELRQELLKSEKLKRHFEENPEDLQHLRHDGELRAVRVQTHLKHVPDYLLPSNGAKGITGTQDIGFVGKGRTSENRIRRSKALKRASQKGKGKGLSGRKIDPLKTFNANGRRKK